MQQWCSWRCTSPCQGEGFRRFDSDLLLNMQGAVRHAACPPCTNTEDSLRPLVKIHLGIKLGSGEILMKFCNVHIAILQITLAAVPFFTNWCRLELLQLWYTHFILVKAFLGSSPSSPTKFQIEGNVCEAVIHKNRSRRSYCRQPINLYKIRLVYIVANSKRTYFIYLRRISQSCTGQWNVKISIEG